MATTYSTRLRLAKQGTGDNADTWGGVLNSAVFDLVDDAVSGVTSVNVSTGSNITLTTNSGATDEARKMVLKLTGTPSTNISVIVPNLEKVYVIDGSAIAGANTVTVIGSSGTGIEFSAGETGVVYSDGTNVNEVYKTPAAAVAGTPLLRPGDLKNSAKTIDHDSMWLVCNGRTLDSVTNTEYADLYTAIGVAYGGTSASNFNIPDYRGRVHAGQDNMGGTSANVLTNAAADSLGGIAGAEKSTVTGTSDGHGLTEAENGPHTHDVPFSMGPSGQTISGGATFFYNVAPVATDSSGSGDLHDHGFTSDGTSDTTQPYLAGYVFIMY